MTGLAPCFPCPSPESAEQGGWRQGAWHRAMKKSQEEVSRISCFLLCPVNDGAGATGAQHPGVGRQGGGPPARGPPGSSQPGSRTFAPQTPRAQLQGRGSVDPSPRAQEHHCTAIPLAGNSIFLQAPNTHTHTHTHTHTLSSLLRKLCSSRGQGHCPNSTTPVMVDPVHRLGQAMVPRCVSHGKR